MTNWLTALIKYALSFSKRTWSVDDYPLRFRHWPEARVPMSMEGGQIPWHVQVVNWWMMSGSGNTKEEAYEDLRQALARFWSSRGYLPRPGTRVPIEFASMNGVKKFDSVARDFLQRILKQEPAFCLITDESSLSDFGNAEAVEQMVVQIKEHYGVDVSEIPDGNLVAIFRSIDASKRA